MQKALIKLNLHGGTVLDLGTGPGTQAIATLLKPNGYLFLKCFSAKRSINDGSYQFQSEEIVEIFRNKFRLISLEETVYQGTVEPFPPALFLILQKLG